MNTYLPIQLIIHLQNYTTDEPSGDTSQDEDAGSSSNRRPRRSQRRQDQNLRQSADKIKKENREKGSNDAAPTTTSKRGGRGRGARGGAGGGGRGRGRPKRERRVPALLQDGAFESPLNKGKLEEEEEGKEDEVILFIINPCL